MCVASGNAATKKLEKLLKCNATLDIEELQQKRKMLVLPEKLWPPGTFTAHAPSHASPHTLTF
jgi:hypothetical protein